jgi:RimJ/RimL family protein N-acetyltransferase
LLILETPRLLLRRFRPEDAETLRRWRADQRYMRYIGEATRNPAVTTAALERWERHWDERGYGLLAAEDRATGALVGRAGPQFHGAWPDDPEVGWAVDPGWWGRGIATEMGAACVQWAFGDLGLRRLVSITVEANLASRRVMEKLGFTLLTTRDDVESGSELWVHALDAPPARRE